MSRASDSSSDDSDDEGASRARYTVLSSAPLRKPITDVVIEAAAERLLEELPFSVRISKKNKAGGTAYFLYAAVIAI